MTTDVIKQAAPATQKDYELMAQYAIQLVRYYNDFHLEEEIRVYSTNGHRAYMRKDGVLVFEARVDEHTLRAVTFSRFDDEARMLCFRTMTDKFNVREMDFEFAMLYAWSKRPALVWPAYRFLGWLQRMRHGTSEAWKRLASHPVSRSADERC